MKRAAHGQKNAPYMRLISLLLVVVMLFGAMGLASNVHAADEEGRPADDVIVEATEESVDEEPAPSEEPAPQPEEEEPEFPMIEEEEPEEPPMEETPQEPAEDAPAEGEPAASAEGNNAPTDGEAAAPAEGEAAPEEGEAPKEGEESEKKEEESAMPPQHFEDYVNGIYVVVNAPKDALPKDSSMVVTAEDETSYLESAAEAVKGSITAAYALKISFYDADDNPILPQVPVETYLVSDLGDNAQLFYIDEASQANWLSQGAEAAFFMQEYSVYLLVAAKKQLVTSTITGEGKTLNVSVSFEEAVIPDGAELVVSEIQGEDEGWFQRSVQLADVLSSSYGNVTMSDARSLSIRVKVDDQEIAVKGPAQITIEYVEPLNTADPTEYGYDEILGELVVPKEKVNRFAAIQYMDSGAVLLKAENTAGAEGIVKTVFEANALADFDLVYMYDYNAYTSAPGADYDPSATIQVIDLFGGEKKVATTQLVKAAGLKAAGAKAAEITAEGDVEPSRSVGQVPAHGKTLTDNGNGTYTIGLSVEGDADTSSNTASNANVVIIYDVSTSMTYNYVPMATGGRGLDTSSGNNYQDGDYFQLYRRNDSGTGYTALTNDNYSGTVYRRSANRPYTYTEYTEQRYSYSVYRADAGEKTVYDFTHALFGYQNADDPSTPQNESTNIQAAYITFADRVYTNTGWTSTESTITNYVYSSGTQHHGGNNGHGGDYHNYTNWEAALSAAYTLISGNTTDNDPTYVIFITDGRPQTNGSTDARANYLNTTDEALNIQTTCDGKGGAFFGIYAYGKEQDWLASLMYYAYEGARPANSIEGTTFVTEGYYNAADTTTLTQAINDIFQRIVQTLGITDVSIADGTTSNVATSTGVAHLLDVDDTTFKYWLSIPVVGSDTTYTFSMVDLRAGEQVTYTATQSDGNITLSWTDPNDHTAKTATYNGSVNLGTMTIEWSEDWTDAQKAFYNKTPPEATFNTSTGSVDWNLRPIGTLLDGVTYTVTFECYPSQETLDLIADLKNGDVTYGDSKYGDVWDYLAPDYTLETNTSASLTYTDTRPGGTSGTAYYDNPEPQPVNATEQITVSKKWNNTLDNRTGWQQNLELFVKRDGVEVHAVELTNTNNWTNKAFISYGIITEDANGVHVKTTGHDYSFSEDVETGYYWEIKAPTVRPMMINGASDPTLLKLLDTAEGDVIPAAISGATGANAKAVDGGKTYYKLTIDGEVKYYVVIDSADAALTAVNHRRSYLDVVKTVTGNHVPEGDEFDFTMTVNNANADTADPDDTNSDAWVWFSIWDTSANAMVTDPNAATATGLRWQLNDETVVTTKPAAANFNGYFCVRSGTTISVNMQNGYSLRFLNLPEGSTYTIAEGTLTNDGYTFVSIEGSKSYDADMNSTTTDDWTTDAYGTVNGQSITGTIDRVETAYKVEVTNQWSNIDVQLKKVEGTELLSGSTFTLYSGDTVIGSYSPGGTASEIDPTTGDEVSVPLGNPIDLGGLGIGIYKLVETEVPTYYKKADDVYFQVYKENGTLKARLVDQTGAPLSDQSMMTSETGSDGPVYTITVNNEREEYSVTVKKLVTGNMGDVNREFSFTWYYTLNGTDSDSQTFTLIHNQTTTLSNIPAGATLTVTETSAQDDGYTTTNNQGNGLTATLAVTEDGLEIVFTNDKVVIPDTGVELPVLPFAIILMLCVTALGVLFISRRRRAW